VEQVLRVSSTSLVRVDRNRYSVPAVWAGRVVSVRLTAERLRVVAGKLVQGFTVPSTLGDGIDANDKAFTTTFPYLATPHLTKP
jgi:hypothetical protein